MKLEIISLFNKSRIGTLIYNGEKKLDIAGWQPIYNELT